MTSTTSSYRTVTQTPGFSVDAPADIRDSAANSLRIFVLRRRLRLSPDAAALIAALAYGEEQQ